MLDFLDETIKVILAGYGAEYARLSLIPKQKINHPIGDSHTLENYQEEFIDHSVNQFFIIYHWASKIYTYNFLEPLETVKSTVKLDLSFQLKTQPKHSSETEIFNEDEIVFHGNNLVIIGDPGSGKTTTLKRLLLKQFFEPGFENRHFQFPILLVCRDIQIELPIEVIIAETLGIEYETRNDHKIQYFNPKNTITELIYITKYYYGDILLIDFLKDVIEKYRFLLVIDGLDEINHRDLSQVINAIEYIGKFLKNGKILITCRPSFVSKRMESFSYCQICELTPDHISRIASLYIENVDQFLQELASKSYADLATRPLFLTYLILIYMDNKNNSKLPLNSVDVYEEIIHYFIIKWDKERDVTRKSKYSLTLPSQKIKFLSHLSFLLTYKIKSKVFTRNQLAEAYKELAPAFSLPEYEAEEVAEEIETHTGIISKSFGNYYEFSHLSLQEYLCAKYINNENLPYKISYYFKEYPPPLALTIALADDSSQWFIKVVVMVFYKLKEGIEYYTLSATILFKRLCLENPYFKKSKEFGIAILLICDLCDSSDTEFSSIILQFVENRETVAESIFEALQEFSILSPDRPKFYKIRFTWNKNSKFNKTELSKISNFGALPLAIYKLVTKDTKY